MKANELCKRIESKSGPVIVDPRNRPAWARITPLAPPLGILTSAVIVWERFFVLMKIFSDMPVIPSKTVRCGRPLGRAARLVGASI